jgi:hypothetical protein
MKLGIVLPYSGADMSLLIDRVLEAERLGFDSVPDFHRGLGFTRRFARKRRETACRLRRLGRREGRRAE